jgi:hypothetical protein
MNTWRQIHIDGSQSVISSSGNFWQARLLHADGNSTQVGLLSSGVEEAKLMCEMAGSMSTRTSVLQSAEVGSYVQMRCLHCGAKRTALVHSSGARLFTVEMPPALQTSGLPADLDEWPVAGRARGGTARLKEENTMNKMNPVVHFEMPFEDRKRMAEFTPRHSAGRQRCWVKTWATMWW